MLSDDRIFEIAEAYGTLDSEYRRAEFARAIEDEAQKQDTALILQLVEALELARRLVLIGGASTHDEIDALFVAASAVRARLESKP